MSLGKIQPRISSKILAERPIAPYCAAQEAEGIREYLQLVSRLRALLKGISMFHTCISEGRIETNRTGTMHSTTNNAHDSITSNGIQGHR